MNNCNWEGTFPKCLDGCQTNTWWSTQFWLRPDMSFNVTQSFTIVSASPSQPFRFSWLLKSKKRIVCVLKGKEKDAKLVLLSTWILLLKCCYCLCSIKGIACSGRCSRDCRVLMHGTVHRNDHWHFTLKNCGVRLGIWIVNSKSCTVVLNAHSDEL